ncbi:MAG TPA: tail fiber domain-containing protein, partial [Candidatus Paceibacterota bacterium]|nr:tail fiber domain-containing protein [Candidatus Paceibacterota bacterium]
SVVLGNDNIVTTALKGNVGIGLTNPTSYLNLKAGTATAGTSPLKFTSGVLLTIPEDGSIEYNGSHYYGSIGTRRYQLDQQLSLGLNASAGLIIGDSTSAAYGGQNSVDTYLLTSSDTLVGTTITNQAVSGHTILQQQNTWTADANKATYDWIVVMVGLNDLDPAESAATALGRYQTLINTINAGKKTGAIVIVSTMTPDRQWLINTYGGVNGPIAYQKWLDMNTAIMGGGANAITGVSYRVNNHTLALNDGSGNMALAYDNGDYIHENNAGRALIASEWRSVLNRAGFLTATPPTIYDKYFSNNTTSTFLKSGNFGVGTTDPQAKIDVSGDGIIRVQKSVSANPNRPTTGVGLEMEYAGSADIAIIRSYSRDTSAYKPLYLNGSSVILNSDGSGNVGIGTNSVSAQKLVVAGNIRVGTGTTGCVEDADGTLLTGTCSSDERLKKNINPLGDVLDRLVQITPVTYNWRSDEFPERYLGDSLQTGLIAQEVEEQFPELVVTDSNGFKQITFQYLPFYMLQGIKELNLKVEDLSSLDTSSSTSLGSLIKNFLGDVNNTINNLYASVIHSDKIETQMLCVGSTCVTEQQFLDLINKNTNQVIIEQIPSTPVDELDGGSLDENNEGLENVTEEPPTCSFSQTLIDNVCVDSTSLINEVESNNTPPVEDSSDSGGGVEEIIN